MVQRKKGQKGKNIFDKIELTSIVLEKVDGENLSKDIPESDKEFMLEIKWNYSIKKHDKDRLVLIANCKLYFVPKGVLELDLEYSITYVCKEEIYIEEIEEEIVKLIQPCGDLNSLIIAQLTDKMLGEPLILPPLITLDKK